MTLCFESQYGFQFHPRRPAQPANQPKNLKWANSVNFYPIEFKVGAEVIYNLPDGNWMFEVAGTIFVRDGKYSTLMGVVVVVVAIFTMG